MQVLKEATQPLVSNALMCPPTVILGPLQLDSLAIFPFRRTVRGFFRVLFIFFRGRLCCSSCEADGEACVGNGAEVDTGAGVVAGKGAAWLIRAKLNRIH